MVLALTEECPSPLHFNLFSLGLLFFFSSVYSFFFFVLSFFFCILNPLCFWVFGFFSFSLPSLPLESFVFIGNIPGSPFMRGSFLDKHGWEGGVGFLLGLGYLRFDPYLLGVVIFMKIRFVICVLVGLGCRHSIIFSPFFKQICSVEKTRWRIVYVWNDVVLA